jgi:geranylgeranyl diphosphate synthase type II
MTSSISPAADLAQRLKARQEQVDARLDQLLPPVTAYPEQIHRAMRHSIFAGGKRIRPVLCLEAAEACAPAGTPPLDAACALECIHTYSLIHDDLPALDNDDFRRGQPTCHKVFGEATAILAGDALMTLAYQILAGDSTVSLDRRALLVAEVARATGTVDGMIGGQVVDLESEGREVDYQTLEYIHHSKTGALIRASLRTGALHAGADLSTLELISSYGSYLGLLFQIVDDILDVESSTEQLGKTAGKDAAQQKATYPGLFGLETAREMARKTMENAVRVINLLGSRGFWLRDIALYLGSRRS